jgi:hypothetical protein
MEFYDEANIVEFETQVDNNVSICAYCKSIKIDDVYVPVKTILPDGLGYKPFFTW